MRLLTLGHFPAPAEVRAGRDGGACFNEADCPPVKWLAEAASNQDTDERALIVMLGSSILAGE